MMRRSTFLILLVAGVLCAQSSKPSPFPSRNPKRAGSVKAAPAPIPVEDENEIIRPPKPDQPAEPAPAQPAPAQPAAPPPMQKASVGVTTGSLQEKPAAAPKPAPAPPIPAPAPTPEPVSISREAELCRATFYGSKADGARTASGEGLNNEELTLAHGSLPFGTTLKLVNISNGRSVTARVNDRIRGGEGCRVNVTVRIARELGFTVQGSAQLALQRVQ